MRRPFHDFLYFFKFITALLLWLFCMFSSQQIAASCNPSSKLPWPGPCDCISPRHSISISHAGSHGEFSHVRQHDKEDGALICIHEALKKFKDKLQSRIKRPGSTQTVQTTTSISDFTIPP